VSSPNRPIQVIDVELLVEELKARLERERAAGAYADDLSGVALRKLAPTDAATPLGAAYDSAAPRVRFRPELGFSSKPVIGPVITLVKRFILRLLFHVMDDLARQTDAALGRVEVALAVQAGELERKSLRLDAESQRLDARVISEVDAREAVQFDVKSLAEHLTRIDSRLEHLQLESRLARLERARKPTHDAPVRTSAGDANAPEILAPAFDYEIFESRFRSEESVREHQLEYVELMRGKKRVVDLGCGRGELVEMLRSQGISAYGVEIEPDFIALLEEKGIEVVAQDAVTHLEALEPGAVDGVVASHVVEHLSAAALSRLVVLTVEKLPESGILLLETPNPESLIAGSVNFHRDLTHVRPIHPDTLAFLAESAGFSKVEIRRMSPVPDEELLPTPSDQSLKEIVQQLNDLIYGYQDYAVVARK
jgi:2-polyprenyl-3-methyl-5-hydroxy-6-metoxy-1,4-benzoquinol methylase